MCVIGITPINNDVKEEKSMKFLQKLGKALMLPVAVLPICGILMGIGYMLCPETMQGGDIKGAADMIGLFLVKAGGALIDNMAILFVIGVGVGMSDKNDGTGGIAALASWLMMTTLLSTKFVTVIIPSIADSATKTLAFNKIENPFIGILAGIIGAMCYNKFKDTKLPNWLSFFSGKRCVAIVSGVVSILVSVVLLFV
jgi:PTS system N-acetylglucosamine-specific IIC component